MPSPRMLSEVGTHSRARGRKSNDGHALSLQELALSLRRLSPPLSPLKRDCLQALSTQEEELGALGVTEIEPDFWE